MGLYTQLINVITFGGPHRVALLCMLQTHWFELINGQICMSNITDTTVVDMCK